MMREVILWLSIKAHLIFTRELPEKGPRGQSIAQINIVGVVGIVQYLDGEAWGPVTYPSLVSTDLELTRKKTKNKSKTIPVFGELN